MGLLHNILGPATSEHLSTLKLLEQVAGNSFFRQVTAADAAALVLLLVYFNFTQYFLPYLVFHETPGMTASFKQNFGGNF